MRRAIANMADDMESLAGVTAESMADEVRANAKAFRMVNSVAGLIQIPLLVLSADDGLTPGTDALIRAIQVIDNAHAMAFERTSPAHRDNRWSA